MICASRLSILLSTAHSAHFIISGLFYSTWTAVVPILDSVVFWSLWGLHCNWIFTFTSDLTGLLHKDSNPAASCQAPDPLQVQLQAFNTSIPWDTPTHYLPSSAACLRCGLGHLVLQLLCVVPKEILPRRFHPNSDDLFVNHSWLFSPLAYQQPQSLNLKYHVSCSSEIFVFLWNIRSQASIIDISLNIFSYLSRSYRTSQ